MNDKDQPGNGYTGIIKSVSMGINNGIRNSIIFQTFTRIIYARWMLQSDHEYTVKINYLLGECEVSR